MSAKSNYLMSILSRFDWKNWRIGTRLIVIAAAPVIYLFCSFLSYSYYSHASEVQEELNARAKTISTALAEGVQYNLVSGNLQGIKQMIYGVLQSDHNIYRIEIFDAARKEISHVENMKKGREAGTFFELPIGRQLIWVNLVPMESDTERTRKDSFIEKEKDHSLLGYVRVTMTPTIMQANHKYRFTIELFMAIFALFVSAWMAHFLARGLTNPLRTSIETLREIRAGDTSQQVEVSTGGELGELQLSINEMAQSLHLSQQELEKKVAERTHELMLSRNEALKADAEKRKLIHKVNSIVEAERQSIAVEIHDELNASLIAVRLESERIARIAAKAVKANEDKASGSVQNETLEYSLSQTLNEVQARAKEVIKLALNLYANGRNLVRRLRPEVLDMLGLDGAVEEMLRVYNDGHDGCAFHFSSQGNFSQLDADLAISAYRIVQEASSNIIKHANAKQVNIDLTVNQESKRLTILIQDDGQGFEPALSVNGIGITGMRERVLVLDGDFNLRSAIGAGTEIAISLPLVVTTSLPVTV
jgi:two-component system sensor histidine kinase UhpB